MRGHEGLPCRLPGATARFPARLDRLSLAVATLLVVPFGLAYASAPGAAPHGSGPSSSAQSVVPSVVGGPRCSTVSYFDGAGNKRFRQDCASPESGADSGLPSAPGATPQAARSGCRIVSYVDTDGNRHFKQDCSSPPSIVDRSGDEPGKPGGLSASIDEPAWWKSVAIPSEKGGPGAGPACHTVSYFDSDGNRRFTRECCDPPFAINAAGDEEWDPACAARTAADGRDSSSPASAPPEVQAPKAAGSACRVVTHFDDDGNKRFAQECRDAP
jgi:hypothetical protein